MHMQSLECMTFDVLVPAPALVQSTVVDDQAACHSLGQAVGGLPQLDTSLSACVDCI